MHYWQDMVHPLKASGGELNTSKKEVVLAATLKNSYTLCHGKLWKYKYMQVKNGIKQVHEGRVHQHLPREQLRCDACSEHVTATVCLCAEGWHMGRLPAPLLLPPAVRPRVLC